MKKPKKTAAAKPRPARTTRSRAKTGAKISKAKPAKTVKKIAAKKTRKVAAVAVKRVTPIEPAVLPKPAPEPKAAAIIKRKVKAKPAAAAEPVPETKPRSAAPRRTSATAKAAPKSPLLDAGPLSAAKSAAKVISPGEFRPRVLEKAVAKPKAKEEPLPPQPSAEEKPEMGVELIFEKKKTVAKPRAKTKRVAKPKSVVAVPASAPAEKKPAEEPKATVAKPAPIAKPPATKPSSRPARKAPANIPAILLEGDKPEPAPLSGPGHRYALGPKPPVEKLQTEGELPESYGTGTVFLTARDPHWLYAHWDLSGEQQRQYNGFSRHGHLVVRIYVDAVRGKPVAQAHVHPDSRHWFVHVDLANTRYVAELGYYSAADKWKVIATSEATLTPPDAVSADTTAEFGMMPSEVPMGKLVALVKEAVQESAPLAQAIEELREEGHRDLPRMEPLPVRGPEREQPEFAVTSETRRRDAGAPGQRAASSEKTSSPRWIPREWTPAQERALAEVISMDHVRRVWMGSLEITELIRRQYVNELASMAAAESIEFAPGAPTSPTRAIGGISSPAPKPGAREKGFWFNVNAELIVYGATEPDAAVSIAGRKIRLRPDGSFSYRFALPDGNYEMPVVAVSADGTDGRAAELKFSRGTGFRGDVGAHPQDPSLKRMAAENF